MREGPARGLFSLPACLTLLTVWMPDRMISILMQRSLPSIYPAEEIPMKTTDDLANKFAAMLLPGEHVSAAFDRCIGRTSRDGGTVACRIAITSGGRLLFAQKGAMFGARSATLELAEVIQIEQRGRLMPKLILETRGGQYLYFSQMPSDGLAAVREAVGHARARPV